MNIDPQKGAGWGLILIAAILLVAIGARVWTTTSLGMALQDRGISVPGEVVGVIERVTGHGRYPSTRSEYVVYRFRTETGRLVKAERPMPIGERESVVATRYGTVTYLPENSNRHQFDLLKGNNKLIWPLLFALLAAGIGWLGYGLVTGASSPFAHFSRS